MIAKYLKTYTIFNGLYKNRNKKMYSRKLKKEVIGNRLHTGFFKEYWETLTIKMDMWDLQIEINNYFPNPLKNPNVSFLISQMREAVIILKNEQNEYGQYIRDETIRFLEWFDSEYPQPIKIPEQVKPKMNVPIFALYIYYLQRGKYIDGTQIDMINEIKKKTGIKFKTESIANYFRNITQKNNKDPLTPDNLRKVIELLDLYPKAKERAEQDLSELIL